MLTKKDIPIFHFNLSNHVLAETPTIPLPTLRDGFSSQTDVSSSRSGRSCLRQARASVFHLSYSFWKAYLLSYMQRLYARRWPEEDQMTGTIHPPFQQASAPAEARSLRLHLPDRKQHVSPVAQKPFGAILKDPRQLQLTVGNTEQAAKSLNKELPISERPTAPTPIIPKTRKSRPFPAAIHCGSPQKRALSMSIEDDKATPPIKKTEENSQVEKRQPAHQKARVKLQMTWGYRILCLILLGSASTLIYLLWFQPVPTDAASTSPQLSQASPTHHTDTTSGPTIKVYVIGAIKKPGIYTLPEAARVHELLEAAGGAQPDADLVTLNLAARLVDGQEVYVTKIGEIPPAYIGGVPVPAPYGNNGLLNINTATLEELDQRLPLTTSQAQSIIAYRLQRGFFKNIEDLSPILGKATYDKVKFLITV